MSQAHLQLPLDQESQELRKINTHRGLFKYCRLPFGVSAAAPAIFQLTMESLLEGIFCYLDDLLISGATKEMCLKHLSNVLEQLTTAKLRLKRTKCLFLKKSLQFLGHTISDKGLQPTGEKVQAIQNMPSPKNVMSFLGILNYYGKLFTKLAPLYKLLRKEVKWIWDKEQESAFQEVGSLTN